MIEVAGKYLTGKELGGWDKGMREQGDEGAGNEVPSEQCAGGEKQVLKLSFW
jgi:hypothetical protein